MSELFGTDGVRGIANTELSPELVLQLGRAAAVELGGIVKRPTVVVARDTRISGEMLESALVAGLLSAGADVVRCEVLPTPAVAFLVTHLRAAAGAVVSGSHNPVQDNGIKFFGPDGFKLADADEAKIEDLLGSEDLSRPVGVDVGRPGYLPEAEALYVDHALKALEGRSLVGLKVVVDCANGAAFRTTPEALIRAGAEVVVINAAPDGTNINVRCGSNHPEVLAETVLSNGADVGFAHDGDADRVIAVDETGEVIDGDQMMALCAVELKEQGRLKNNLVVATVMANLGFRLAMSSESIDIVETAVGDRYVIEAMREREAVVGGEQSGHLIFSEYATTGDGLIAALRVLGRMTSTGKSVSQLASLVKRCPQVLVNVVVGNKDGLPEASEVWEGVQQAEQRLGETGRVLVRPSGTESLVRVMVEAQDESVAQQIAVQIADLVRNSL
ncbi:MAG: phosphoglucosamine mutase [Actinomycetota bacterium]